MNLVLTVLLALALVSVAEAQSPNKLVPGKSGGVLNVLTREELSIQKKLDDDAARPMLAWRYDDYAHWPSVKNLFPRHSAYSYGRMQDVWLDR